MSKVRTRFAPSPTGYMHVGNLRTALYTYLTAKRENGTFILRIEDTDQGRLVSGSIDIVYKTMRETGLIWDEGPDIGGPVGPYVQSERMEMFKDYAEVLVKEGKAYYCFCTEEQIEEMRAEQIASGKVVSSYDRRCRDLSQEDIDQKFKNGEPYVIRQKMPLEGTTFFDDLIFGRIEVNNSELEDQILIKTDGMPTYNFANVIDDHLMNITHVIRGNEYLSSTPKYNLLYQSFGWEPPIYIHCPPVMKDVHSKLSKRNGDASYQDLIKKGYLSEAILNYLLLLGWSPVGEREIFSLEEMIVNWDPSRISKSPAIFDIQKLKAINSIYIKKLPLHRFMDLAKPWIGDSTIYIQNMEILCKNLQTRCNTLSEIPEQVAFIKERPNFDFQYYYNKKMKTTPESSLNALEIVLPILKSIDNWSPECIFSECSQKANELEIKNGTLLYPLGIAIAGTPKTPGGGTDLAVILGKDETINRIIKAINELKLVVS